MNHDFNHEIIFLKKINNIKDKLMIFSIYFEIYNTLFAALNNSSEKKMEHYLQFLEATFTLNCASISITNQIIDPKEFFDCFFTQLLYAPIPQEIRAIIINHKKHLDQIIIGMRYVTIFDIFDIDFNLKSQMIMTFREHVNNIYNAMYQIYGQEYYQAALEISNVLANLLPLMSIDNLENFKSDLKLETEKLINQKISTLELSKEEKKSLELLIPENIKKAKRDKNIN